jgi:hypothetical protein
MRIVDVTMQPLVDIWYREKSELEMDAGAGPEGEEEEADGRARGGG